MSALATESLPSNFQPDAWPEKDPAVFPFVFDPADEVDPLEWRDPRNSLGENLVTWEGHVVPYYEIDPDRPWQVRRIQYPDDLLNAPAKVIEMASVRESKRAQSTRTVAQVAPRKVDPKRPAPTRDQVTIDDDGFALHHRVRLLKAGHSITFVAATGGKTLLGPEDYPEGAQNRVYMAAEKFGLGLLYAHASLDEGGDPWYQIEPDVRHIKKADGTEYGKYINSDEGRLMCHPLMAERFRAGDYERLILAEGTKQHLTMAFLRKDREKDLVLGVAGCWSWSQNSGATIVEDLDRALRGEYLKDVIVAFDKDVNTKRGVRDAADRLKGQVIAVTGRKPRFLNLPVGSGESNDLGFDDYVAGRYMRKDSK